MIAQATRGADGGIVGQCCVWMYYLHGASGQEMEFFHTHECQPQCHHQYKCCCFEQCHRPWSTLTLRSGGSNMRSGSNMWSGGSHPTTSNSNPSRSSSNMRFGGHGPLWYIVAVAISSRPPSRPRGVFGGRKKRISPCIYSSHDAIETMIVWFMSFDSLRKPSCWLPTMGRSTNWRCKLRWVCD